jgi:hypothetical protein
VFISIAAGLRTRSLTLPLSFLRAEIGGLEGVGRRRASITIFGVVGMFIQNRE